MRGTLSADTFVAALRRLADDGATGALHIEGPDGAGRVFLRDGQVYWAVAPAAKAQLGARLVGAGHLTEDELEAVLAGQERGPRRKLGALLVERDLVPADLVRAVVFDMILDAIVDVMSWGEGSFEFFRGDAVAEDLAVQMPVARVVAEGTRRLEEWRQIVARLGSLDEAPRLVHGAARSAELSSDDFTVLRNIDGRRSITELASDLGYSLFHMAQLVDRLVQLGVAEVGGGRAGGDGASGVADLAEWLIDEGPTVAHEAREEQQPEPEPAPEPTSVAVDEPEPEPAPVAAVEPEPEPAPVAAVEPEPEAPPAATPSSATVMSPLTSDDLDRALQEALAAATSSAAADDLPRVDVLVQPLAPPPPVAEPPARRARPTPAPVEVAADEVAPPVAARVSAPAIDLEPSVDEPPVWEAVISDTPAAPAPAPAAPAAAAAGAAPPKVAAKRRAAKGAASADRPARTSSRQKPAAERAVAPPTPAAATAPTPVPAPAPPPAPPPPRPAVNDDVSELLRELSRLSGEEADAAPAREPTPPPPPAAKPPTPRPQPRAAPPPPPPEERKGIRRIFGH